MSFFIIFIFHLINYDVNYIDNDDVELELDYSGFSGFIKHTIDVLKLNKFPEFKIFQEKFKWEESEINKFEDFFEIFLKNQIIF